MFFKKSALETDEYQTLIKRLIDLEARVLSLETNNAVFRDKVLRKVQVAREEPEEINMSEGGLLRHGNFSKQILLNSRAKGTPQKRS